MAKTPAKRPTAAKQADLDLARRAYAKIKAGQRPTVREQAALGRLESARDREERRRLLTGVAKRDYLELIGRPGDARRINQQARQHAIPCYANNVDVADVLIAFHELLDREGRRLLADDETRDEAGGEYRREKAAIARLQRLRLENRLVPVAEVHALVERLTELFRAAAEILRKDHPEAADILDEHLEDAERLDTFQISDDATSK